MAKAKETTAKSNEKILQITPAPHGMLVVTGTEPQEEGDASEPKQIKQLALALALCEDGGETYVRALTKHDIEGDVSL